MPFNEPEVRVLFPVPLLTFQLAGAAALNARLLPEVAERRRREPGVQRSNRNGWHSNNDLFARTEPAQAELALEIAAMLEAATAKLVPELPATMTAKVEGWINVGGLNAFNAPHDHPGVFWSGCYYVQVPAVDDADDVFAGAIEFLDPRGSIGSNGMIGAPFTRANFTARPAPGQCLIWPSFVKHWVHPNRSESERVTVAFNGWFVRA